MDARKVQLLLPNNPDNGKIGKVRSIAFSTHLNVFVFLVECDGEFKQWSVLLCKAIYE